MPQIGPLFLSRILHWCCKAVNKRHQGEEEHGDSGTSQCKAGFGTAQMCLTPTTHRSEPRMQSVTPCVIDVEVFDQSLLQKEVLLRMFLCFSLSIVTPPFFTEI
jgi:hypothetical protein